MKLTVTRQELLDKLSNIQNIVEKRNTMPILSHFLLDAKKEGSFITATDIETALREPIELAVAEEGRLCIPARKLFEIAKEIDGDLTIETEDSEWIRVSAGKSSFRLACLPPDEFPSWPEMEDAKEIGLEPASLAKMIEKTIYAAGESDTRYTLNGLLFHITGGKITIEEGSQLNRQAETFDVTEFPEDERTIYCQKYKNRWYVDGNRHYLL